MEEAEVEVARVFERRPLQQGSKIAARSIFSAAATVLAVLPDVPKYRVRDLFSVVVKCSALTHPQIPNNNKYRTMKIKQNKKTQ
jgi:hypothetical protein